MAKHPIFWVKEDTESAACFKQGDDVQFAEQFRPASIEEMTPEGLAEMLDQDAANYNKHPFDGLHGELIYLLIDQIGRDETTRVMRALAEQHRGLHGMKIK